MIRQLASIGVAAAAVIAFGAAPAHADDEIGLSRDGVTWTTELAAPLFAPDFRFVPGDVEVRSFRVRNDGPSDGVLTVDVVASDPDALLVADDFIIEARVGGGPWLDVDTGTTRVVTELKVPENAQSQVQVRATFDWDSTVQLKSVPFHVELTLSEDGDVAGEEEGNGEGNGDGEVGGESGGLPDTGSGFGPGTIWLAAALIGAGIALVRPRRERHKAVIGRG
ncbi:MAG: hypothetical protein NTX33_15555 [Propionibacteriales bacterium]|nr:hypothetical protein [Propionibacteriales bacterium]